MRIFTLLAGIALIAAGAWLLRAKTAEQVTRHRIETRYRTETVTTSSKGRDAAIGAGAGGVLGGTAAALLGGVGLAACGTGVGIPAGIGMIAAGTALGAGTGALAGAAVGETHTETRKVPYQVSVPYTETVYSRRFHPAAGAVAGIAGLAMLIASLAGAGRTAVPAPAPVPVRASGDDAPFQVDRRPGEGNPFRSGANPPARSKPGPVTMASRGGSPFRSAVGAEGR